MVVQDSFRNDLVSSPLKNNQKHRLKQRFDVQRKLGQGTYGKVQLAVNRETGQEVAVKTIKKNKIETEQDLVRIRREIQIMSSIQHPHITHIYEVFENKDKIVLVMQFASGGELYDYLSEKKVLSDVEARRIFRQIAAAVYYCHKNKICHRDLKLENILLDEKGNAKIADFGLSNVFDDKNLLNTYCGSPLYASPEIVKGVPYYGPEVDCWSMGVLLYTLVYGAMPFDGSNFKKLVTQISEGDYFEPKKKSNASDLIRKLLTVNPSKRATIVDICVDYWVNHGYEHSLLQVAEDMANLTPVRFDLLLALAPDATPPAATQEPPPKKDVATADIPDEDEEEEEEDEYNGDTAANSFAFVKGSRASQLSVSSPNLQEAVEEEEDEDDDDFLPADIAAALQAECGKRLADSSSSFGASLARISSLAHKSKKPRKSESTAATKDDKTAANASKTNVAKEVKQPEPDPPPVADNAEKKAEEAQPEESQKPGPRKDSLAKSGESPFARKESLTAPPEEKVLGKKMGRPPGKIVIPKTFDSPQSTPSPKPGPPLKSVGRSDSKPETEDVPTEKPKTPEVKEAEAKPKSPAEDINKNIISAEPESEVKPNVISEEKKNMAKGILKKGIAKAKLAERRMSKQSSVDSEVSSPCSTPASTGGTPEPMPSFFKTPKPYTKEEESSVSSKAEIKLSSTQSSTSTLKNTVSECSKAPLWDSRDVVENDRQLQSKNLNWSTISPTIDSEMSNWREQMEESLRRLSPDDERSSNQSQSYTLSKIEDDKPLVPIARSYKKFTFTKDGACITETKKIYTTPGADGSWTKVEKKTKITTRPGNVEEFEKFRDMHLRSESASLARSDSQSSSGSNDVYDDIFDSWTGDTMMCNMRKMNNMFHKFSRDPFMRRERRRNPFRFFRRTESERNELREASETPDEDFDVHFDDSNPVVYGSQGLWQLLRSANRGAPGRITIQHEPVAYSRSVSQDREAASKSEWKRSGSRASSGYNTGTRSQSRDRTESPREKVLRFVFESPREAGLSSPVRQEKWSSKRTFSRHNPRRDSGVGSDGYESEYSVRHSPTDEMSRGGIRNFMKSWSKEFMSPPPSAKEQLESLPEGRKHRVEQWLDMTSAAGGDSNSSFEIYSDGRKVSPRASAASSQASYATMRPREYVTYGRSSSDRVADCADFFASSFEERRNRSHSFHKEEAPAAAAMRFRRSPAEDRSYLSDGGSSTSHRVNLTVPPGGSARYVRHFSQAESPPPVVQMRVSINRGSPPKGLWEQQPREPSPLPGIRTFSTEVQHCIGGESTPDDKQQKPGKSSSPYKLPAESSLWDRACMENGNTNNNLNNNNNSNNNNKHEPNNRPNDPQSLSSNGANTPDSLEDLAPQENLPLDEVQVKPLGVLWGEQQRPESVLSEQVDLQQRCLEKTSSEIGSIWNQKTACHTFDLLKNLLSDDGLESFSSAKCVASSLEADISVIDDIERLARDEGFRKVPSLMDDLQSPKEVLRQAMKICDSYK